jgi:hypothetical protein
MISSTKINQLLLNLPYGSILFNRHLIKAGYSFSLQQSYRRNGWFRSIGKGVMIRAGHKLLLSGAISGLQQDEGLPVHIGGKTALEMLGYAHNIEINRKNMVIFAPQGFNIPAWVVKNQWDIQPQFVKTDFLPPDIGFVNTEHQGFTLKISGAARAMMECLAMTPDNFDLNEAWEIMQGLSLLTPSTIQNLLSACNSVKVKRLFLHFAFKAEHAWVSKLETSQFDLGRGKRCIVKNGVYIPKFKITLPVNLA